MPRHATPFPLLWCPEAEALCRRRRPGIETRNLTGDLTGEISDHTSPRFFEVPSQFLILILGFAHTPATRGASFCYVHLCFGAMHGVFSDSTDPDVYAVNMVI